MPGGDVTLGELSRRLDSLEGRITGQFGQIQYGPTFAAISINVIGTLAIYLFLNQRVMKGLTAGSVKG